MRNTKVTVEGVEYQVASLTYDQVEAFFPGGSAEAKTRNTVREHTCPVVAASLNNRALGTGKWFPEWDNPITKVDGNIKPEGRLWTPKEIASEMDLAEIIGLYREVTKFSGLRTEVSGDKVHTDAVPEQEKVGEAAAVA